MRYEGEAWVLLHGEAFTHPSFLPPLTLLKQVHEARLDDPSSFIRRQRQGRELMPERASSYDRGIEGAPRSGRPVTHGHIPARDICVPHIEVQCCHGLNAQGPQQWLSFVKFLGTGQPAVPRNRSKLPQPGWLKKLKSASASPLMLLESETKVSEGLRWGLSQHLPKVRWL